MRQQSEGAVNLEKFESDSGGETRKLFQLTVKDLIATYEGQKSVTDKTKLSAVIFGNYAKLKGAEVHRMAMEIMNHKLVLTSVNLAPKELKGK